MANKRPRAPAFTSPKGTFKFPKLSEIDFGSKDYPKPDGEYSVTLRLKAAAPETQAFVAKLQPHYEAACQNGAAAFAQLKAESRKKLGAVKYNPLYTELLDETTEEPTGEISFKFAMKASGEYKSGPKAGRFYDNRPVVFDARTQVAIPGFRFRDREDGEAMADVHAKGKPDIWGGTVGKVSFEVGLDKEGQPGYFIAGTGAAGLKLALTAAQYIDLVSAGQRTAKDYGFGDEGSVGDETQSPFEPDANETADF